MILVTAVTKSCLKDFLLMKFTYDLYHRGHTYNIACDEYCFKYLNNRFENVGCVLCLDIEDGSHTTHKQKDLSSFKNIINAKFQVAIKTKEETEDMILWIDVDHLFINPIDEYIYTDKNDAIITPHYSNGAANEMSVGFYNCGFAFINNIDFLKEWYRIYLIHDQLNIYFEQKSLEFACKSFRATILPINYNFGWWKLLDNRIEGGHGAHFWIDSFADLYVYNKKVINFHFHFFKPSQHDFDQKAFSDRVIEVIKNRNRQEDRKTLEEISRLTNENI